MYKKLKKWVKSAKNRPNFLHFRRDMNFSDPPYRKNMSRTLIKVVFLDS